MQSFKKKGFGRRSTIIKFKALFPQFNPNSHLYKQYFYRIKRNKHWKYGYFLKYNQIKHISNQKHSGKELTLCPGPAEPESLGRPATSSGSGITPR